MLVRHPLGDGEPLLVGHRALLREHALEVGADVGAVAEEHVRAVLDAGDEELRARRRRCRLHESQPEVPVLEEAQRLVEAADLPERVGADDHVRASARHVVAAEQERAELVRRGKRMDVEGTAAAVDHDAPGVDPGRSGGTRRVELRPELPRRPQVVVVEEREPGAARRLGPDVARRRQPAVHLVAHEPYPRVVERLDTGGGVVVGRVVDDHDLDVDVLLRERARQRVGGEHRPAVARRDDDADLRLRHRSFPYARQPAARPPGSPLKTPRRESVHGSRPFSRPDARPRTPQARSRATKRSIRRSPRRRCFA